MAEDIGIGRRIILLKIVWQSYEVHVSDSARRTLYCDYVLTVCSAYS